VSTQVFPTVPTTGGGGTPAIQSDGWFGHGIDGDLTTVGDVTLTRDTFYNNLTIGAGHNVKPAGFHLYVLNTLTIAATGSINDDGGASTGATAGLGLGARGALGALAGAGGNGSAGGTVGSIGNNSNSCTVNASFVSPTGGAGGAGGANAGGNPGTANSYSTQINLNTVWPCITLGHIWGRGGSPSTLNGGSGGGGGGSSTAGTTGGGGGGGGGGVWVAAKNIANSGRISANGGNGGNASGGANGGGGGGGGGGYVVVMYQSGTLGSVTASGGTGGTPVGTGVAGTAGNAGIARTLKMG